MKHLKKFIGLVIVISLLITMVSVKAESVLFADDFNDNSISVTDWTISGNTVIEEDGILKILTTQTDNGGQVSSTPFNLPAGVLTLTRKAKLHSANSYTMPWISLSYRDDSNVVHNVFSLYYGNMSYNGGVHQSVYGTFLALGDANPHYSPSRDMTIAGPAVLWDLWFDERITYDRTTGEVRYLRNGSDEIIGFAPIIPAGTPVWLTANAWGWFTGHSHHIDDLKIWSSSPIANAGEDFSVNEGQIGVMLDGSASSAPDGDVLSYLWTQLPGGTPVTLSDATAQQPTFTAPSVPQGGETLSFELTVTVNGLSDSAIVNVHITNVNHAPVAEAGPDQTVAEGTLVTLDGSASFDVDNDEFSYSWVQIEGNPVSLIDAASATPSFVAPTIDSGGAPGIVASLVFELTVDDGLSADTAMPGYTLANVVDSVTVNITNVNNAPIAVAGVDQTVNENTMIMLNGTGSNDPDSDTLTYTWAQVSGPAVELNDATSSMPNFLAPFVSAGGADLEFELLVDDGYGGSATDRVLIHVQNITDPPLATAARPTLSEIWPPNHGLISIGITGVSDPGNNVTITINNVTQDEPTNGLGNGDTAPDAIINNDTVLLRAERSGNGNGRVYHVHFTASNVEGSASGMVKVSVPRDKKSMVVDGGGLYNSTQ